MTTSEQEHLAAAKRYLAAIADGVTGETLAAYFAKDAVQREFPSRLNPHGATRELDQILEGALRGQKLMARQTYEIIHSVAQGSHVALEVQWTGTLAIPLGGLPAGGEMRARFAVFLEFRNGRIVRQHNYDCFEPW